MIWRLRLTTETVGNRSKEPPPKPRQRPGQEPSSKHPQKSSSTLKTGSSDSPFRIRPGSFRPAPRQRCLRLRSRVALRGPDPKHSGRNESAYHSGNVGEEQQSMRAIFIRHGQSTGNAGILCHDLALLELTELGWQQSREVAASWAETADLIVTSPYLRTQQTAAATIERFPNVPVEVCRSRSSPTFSLVAGMEPSAPNGCPISNGTGPKPTRSSATARMRRASARCSIGPKPRSTGWRLCRLKSLVYVFSHGQFIQAVRSLVVESKLSDRKKMLKFWGKGVRQLPTRSG